MGFMAGFGDGFSRTFSSQMDRRAQEKQDAFRFTFQEYLDNKKTVEAQEKQDAADARKAKAILEGTNAPKEAYPKVYEWVKGGLSDSDIATRLQKGKFEINKPVEGPDKASTVDTQMSDAGMVSGPTAPEAPAEAPLPEERAPVDTGNPITAVFSKIAKGPPSRGEIQQKRRDEAIGKVAGATGKTRDDVLGTLTGGTKSSMPDSSNITFTPGQPDREPDKFSNPREAAIEAAQAATEYERNPTPQNEERLRVATERMDAIESWQMTEALLDAEAKGLSIRGPARIFKDGQYVKNTTVQRQPDGTFKTPTGEILQAEEVVPMDEDEIKMMTNIAGALKKPLEEQNVRRANQEAAIRSYGTMSDIVERTQGKVLAPVTSGLFQTAQKWVTDASVFAEEVINTPEGKEMGPDTLSQLEAWKQKFEAEGNWDDLATQKGLYDIQKAIFAYRIGAAMGQEGRGLSEVERKMFMEMGSSGVTPDKFHQGMADLLLNGTRDIDRQGNSIVNDNSDLKIFRDVYGYEPKSFEYRPIEADLETTTDSDLQKAWGTLKQYDRRDMAPPEFGAKPKEQEQYPAVTSQKEYDALAPGDKYVDPEDGKVYVKKGTQ